MTAPKSEAEAEPETGLPTPPGPGDGGGTGGGNAVDGGMIAWDVARSVAARVARRSSLPDDEWRRLRADFAELTPIAESLVTETTGLTPEVGAARPVVVDRSEWVSANTESFERLLTPLLARLPAHPGASFPGERYVLRAGRTVSGAEMGALLGWMAGRVLGQYDVVLGATTDPAVDGGGRDVLFVGPNIVEVEKRFGFPPRQFRLWIALHELTHRAQFTGVPWMRGHFLSMVDEALGAAFPDSAQLMDGARRLLSAMRARRDAVDLEAGILTFFMDEAQRAVFGRVQGLMSLLEGHGDIVMDRAGADRIPLAAHFSAVLAERRRKASSFARMVMSVVGLDAKMRQYAEGERFVRYVEEVGGPALFGRVWEGPDLVPDSREIKEPARWVERVGAA